MKREVVFICVLLAMSTMHVGEGSTTIKVLVDESRKFVIDEYTQERLIEVFGYPKTTDWSQSFENYDVGWGFGSISKRIQDIASVDIRESGTLSYSVLKDYDVLIIASFTEKYTAAEADAIKEFVENGGGLLVLGDKEFPNNSISRALDVLYSSEVVAIGDSTARKGAEKVYRLGEWSLTVSTTYTFYVEDIVEHPVTKGIDALALYVGIPITNYETGTALIKTSQNTWADKVGLVEEGVGEKGDDEARGPFAVLVAVETGRGRAVFLGTSGSFWNIIVENEPENADLIMNAVTWLGEPGGPYKEYVSLNEQGQKKLQSAKSLYENHAFEQARKEFEESISIFTESFNVYPNADATRGIEEAEDYLEKCTIGVEADTFFGNAETLFDKQEYEKAITEYERAQSLYQKIGYSGKMEKCTAQTKKSQDKIALQNEASSFYMKAEEALTAAESSSRTADYENARSLYEKSKSAWEEYGAPDRVAACQEKIALCTAEIESIERNRMLVVTAAVFMAAVVLFIAVVVVRRRAAAEKVPAEPELDSAEELRDRYVRGEISMEEYENLKSQL